MDSIYNIICLEQAAAGSGTNRVLERQAVWPAYCIRVRNCNSSSNTVNPISASTMITLAGHGKIARLVIFHHVQPALGQLLLTCSVEEMQLVQAVQPMQRAT